MTTVAVAPARVVFVVDDDLSVREGLERLFRSVGLNVKTFASAADFMQCKLPDASACMVLDVRLPGLSGLDFQEQLARSGFDIPIIFMTGHGDIPMTVRAMKAGAVEFLPKPFREQEMLDAVQAGLEHDRRRRVEEGKRSKFTRDFETLTAREREVMGLVTTRHAHILFRTPHPFNTTSAVSWRHVCLGRAPGIGWWEFLAPFAVLRMTAQLATIPAGLYGARLGHSSPNLARPVAMLAGSSFPSDAHAPAPPPSATMVDRGAQ